MVQFRTESTSSKASMMYRVAHGMLTVFIKAAHCEKSEKKISEWLSDCSSVGIQCKIIRNGRVAIERCVFAVDSFITNK